LNLTEQQNKLDLKTTV